jgi:hypothetical protein
VELIQASFRGKSAGLPHRNPLSRIEPWSHCRCTGAGASTRSGSDSYSLLDAYQYRELCSKRFFSRLDRSKCCSDRTRRKGGAAGTFGGESKRPPDGVGGVMWNLRGLLITSVHGPDDTSPPNPLPSDICRIRHRVFLVCVYRAKQILK